MTTNTTLRVPSRVLAAAQEAVPEEAPKQDAAPEVTLKEEPMHDAASQNLEVPSPDAPTAEVVEESKLEVQETVIEYPKYEAGRLTQFILHDGTVVKPEAGVYTATTREMFDLLNYYAQQDAGLVTPLFNL